jgi:cell division transport system permease protein
MKEILKSIRRTPYQSLSAFLTLFFSLFLSAVIFISLAFLYGLLAYIETRPQVTVYFQTNVEENKIFKIREDLNNSGKVASVKYISQKEAFEIYKKLNKDNPLLLEMISSDILPASLEIYAKKPIFLPEIAEYLKKQPGVDEVQFQKDIVDRLLTLTNILRTAAISFFIFLILMTIIVLTTSISFKIDLRKEEIELLRLIGASDFYIRKPFLKESFFLGFIAVTSSFILIVGLLFYFQPFLNSYLRGIPHLFLSLDNFQIQVWPLSLIFLGITYIFSLFFGLSISFIATYFATKKYLKV